SYMTITASDGGMVIVLNGVDNPSPTVRPDSIPSPFDSARSLRIDLSTLLASPTPGILNGVTVTSDDGFNGPTLAVVADREVRFCLLAGAAVPFTTPFPAIPPVTKPHTAVIHGIVEGPVPVGADSLPAGLEAFAQGSAFEVLLFNLDITFHPPS